MLSNSPIFPVPIGLVYHDYWATTEGFERGRVAHKARFPTFSTNRYARSTVSLFFSLIPLLRIPKAPGLSLAGVRLIIPDHALGSPVLRTLSLCTCCRHYPGAAAGRTASLIHPAVSAFPERVVGSACASSFSRLARRLLALRPAHSRCHQFVTR